MSDYEQVLYERIGPVARISHNRPERRNAEGTRMLEEMERAIAEALADDSVRVLVIAGVGNHFSAGHDLKEGESRRHYSVEQRYAHEERLFYDFCLKLRDAPKPTIAQVQGACLAAAFMLANMCDLVVASEDAFFADPVVNTLGAAAVEVLIHPSVLGMRAAKDLLFTGRRMDAREAYKIGMVSRLVPRSELEAETLALAGQIAKAPPFALKLVKRSLHRTMDMAGFRAGLDAHFDTHQLSHASAAFGDVWEKGLSTAIESGRKAVG
ncbi:enoyl-CoA hydratase [Hoeflea sp. BAL378]|uniref:enoyl-CoA hydratase n=1 Tax=Hoeflea sp. BAL378 TaxID=1547437 RepID=UPI00051415A3|nr:enoyl-CoA hydratase [Hoeflea sp. BAL378]KGF70704.1 enoyl-CoA hydratase [Hoeflea sp. BAL378]